MIAVGFDIGTHRIAMSIPTLGFVETIDVSRTHGPARRDAGLRVLMRWTATKVEAQGVQLGAFIERPFLSGSKTNPNTTIGMAETVGVIRAGTPWASSCTLVNPSTWKAELIGDGRATKDEARAWLEFEKKIDVSGYDEDMVDATCVALYGEEVMAGRIALPAPTKRRKRG